MAHRFKNGTSPLLLVLCISISLILSVIIHVICSDVRSDWFDVNIRKVRALFFVILLQSACTRLRFVVLTRTVLSTILDSDGRSRPSQVRSTSRIERRASVYGKRSARRGWFSSRSAFSVY